MTRKHNRNDEDEGVFLHNGLQPLDKCLSEIEYLHFMQSLLLCSNSCEEFLNLGKRIYNYRQIIHSFDICNYNARFAASNNLW